MQHFKKNFKIQIFNYGRGAVGVNFFLNFAFIHKFLPIYPRGAPTASIHTNNTAQQCTVPVKGMFRLSIHHNSIESRNIPLTGTVHWWAVLLVGIDAVGAPRG